MIKLCEMQWKKTKRNFIRVLMSTLPIMYSLIMYFYYSVSSLSNNNKTILFFLLLFISAQFFLSIYTNQFIQIDRDANNFIHELSSKIPREKIILSKILFLLLVLFVTYVLSVVILLLMNLVHSVIVIHMYEFSLYFLLSIIFQTPTLLLNIYISYKYSLYGIVIIATINFLTTVLVGTTQLGTLIWYFVPSSWGSKYIVDFIPGNIYTLENIIMIISLIILDSILIVSQIIWFSKWDGESKFNETL